MALRFHNTLTRRKDDFTPIDPERVRVYVCGPTVYDRAHIGNARPVIVFDVLFRLLRHGKALRGTPLDPFGRTAERRMERALIAEFEADMAEVLPKVTPATLPVARELAELPLTIRGYGPVKEANARKAAARRLALLQALRAGGAPLQHAAE